jgi:hypothetical protein
LRYALLGLLVEILRCLLNSLEGVLPLDANRSIKLVMANSSEMIDMGLNACHMQVNSKKPSNSLSQVGKGDRQRATWELDAAPLGPRINYFLLSAAHNIATLFE